MAMPGMADDFCAAFCSLGPMTVPMHINAYFGPVEFLHIKRHEGRFITEGSASCSVGTWVEPGSGLKPEGIHASWQWDGEALHATNCRYGMYPLFYFTDRDRFCISTSMATLLQQGAPLDLDYTALSVFLRLGFFLGEDTPFAAIRQLPPKAALRWKNGTLEIGSHLTESKLQSISRASAVDGYVSLFRAAIQRRLPTDSEFVVPISGGRDSRHILFELLAAGRTPKFCVTARHFPPRPNPDLETAGELCAVLKVPHVILDLPHSRVRAELIKNVQTHFCTDEHAWGWALVDYLRDRTEVLYDGLAGDNLSESRYLSHERLQMYYEDRHGLARTLLESRMSESVLQRLLNPDFHRKLGQDLALQRLMTELDRHSESVNPVRAFYFWNRTRRAVALLPFGVLNGFRVHTPYLDHDLYDFLTSLPPEITLDHQFHTETIWRAHPQYRAIPFEHKKESTVKDRSYFRQLCREMTGLLLRHGDSGLVRRAFVLSRLAACAMDGNSDWTWWGPSRTLVLLQLEKWMRSGHHDKL
jgi:asparagine synthase (glutamine-hydrolysing)